MSIYVYAPNNNANTTALINALGSKRLRTFDGMRFLQKGKPIDFQKDDAVVCWGRHIPALDYVKVINAHPTALDHSVLRKIATEVAVQKIGISLLPIYPHTPEQIEKLKEYLVVNKKVKYFPYKERTGYVYANYYHAGMQQEFKLFLTRKGVLYAKVSTRPKFEWEPIADIAQYTFPDNVITYATTLMQGLNLDFAAITITLIRSESRGITSTCIRKIVTDPNLNADELPVVANALQQLIAGV